MNDIRIKFEGKKIEVAIATIGGALLGLVLGGPIGAGVGAFLGAATASENAKIRQKEQDLLVR